MNGDLHHCNDTVGAELKIFRHYGGSYIGKTHEYYDGRFTGDLEYMHPRCGIIHLKYLLDSKDKKRELYIENEIYSREQLDLIEKAKAVPLDKTIKFTIENEKLLGALNENSPHC